MSKPRPAVNVDLQQIRLCPRFAVEQGLRPDGSTKVRPVDHLSWWSDPEAANGARLSKKRMKVS